jgi:uncharacterized protein (TIGR02246 family)
MRTVIATLSALVLGAAMTSAQRKASSAPSDNQLVEKAIENWNEAWAKKDSKLAAQDYSEDADWTNAFGMKKKGRAEIQQFLSEVFSLPFVMAGQSRTAEQSVKLIKPDVALVITRVERVGQRTPSGDELPTRQTTHLRVLLKSGGEWKIASHLISDARDPQRAEH